MRARNEAVVLHMASFLLRKCAFEAGLHWPSQWHTQRARHVFFSIRRVTAIPHAVRGFWSAAIYRRFLRAIVNATCFAQKLTNEEPRGRIGTGKKRR